ncbi:hypothetical protein RAZWK3B_11887 [Roseobacter sp. AzwK-3b]|nr:hypothetical protein RAZWK3B_11887 [Roseobacter sp. AzwK-3b]
MKVFGERAAECAHVTIGLDVEAVFQHIHVVFIHDHPKCIVAIQSSTSLFYFRDCNSTYAGLWWLRSDCAEAKFSLPTTSL